MKTVIAAVALLAASAVSSQLLAQTPRATPQPAQDAQAIVRSVERPQGAQRVIHTELRPGLGCTESQKSRSSSAIHSRFLRRTISTRLSAGNPRPLASPVRPIDSTKLHVVQQVRARTFSAGEIAAADFPPMRPEMRVFPSSDTSGASQGVERQRAIRPPVG